MFLPPTESIAMKSQFIRLVFVSSLFLGCFTAVSWAEDAGKFEPSKELSDLLDETLKLTRELQGEKKADIHSAYGILGGCYQNLGNRNKAISIYDEYWDLIQSGKFGEKSDELLGRALNYFTSAGEYSKCERIIEMIESERYRTHCRLLYNFELLKSDDREVARNAETFINDILETPEYSSNEMFVLRFLGAMAFHAHKSGDAKKADEYLLKGRKLASGLPKERRETAYTLCIENEISSGNAEKTVEWILPMVETPWKDNAREWLIAYLLERSDRKTAEKLMESYTEPALKTKARFDIISSCGNEMPIDEIRSYCQKAGPESLKTDFQSWVVKKMVDCKRFDDAKELATEFLETPEREAVWGGIAGELAKQNMTDKASEYIDLCEKEEAKRAVINSIGLCILQSGNREQAFEFLRSHRPEDEKTQIAELKNKLDSAIEKLAIKDDIIAIAALLRELTELGGFEESSDVLILMGKKAIGIEDEEMRFSLVRFSSTLLRSLNLTSESEAMIDELFSEYKKESDLKKRGILLGALFSHQQEIDDKKGALATLGEIEAALIQTENSPSGLDSDSWLLLSSDLGRITRLRIEYGDREGALKTCKELIQVAKNLTPPEARLSLLLYVAREMTEQEKKIQK